MNLSKLGEHKIIEIFTREFTKRECEAVVKSIGDDCAVLKIGDGHFLLISTDTVCERTHVPEEMTPVQIGKYAVNVVLSDIAAMGGSPLGMVFSFAFPPGLDESFIIKLARGMKEGAEEHGTCIIGGDTQESSYLTITGTALGEVEEENLLLRSGAKVGDLICVTGNIGSAAAGFYSLIKGLTQANSFIKAALEPWARLEEGRIVSRFASSCMDISDGLALSVQEITKQSGVGALIYEDRVPVDDKLNDVEMRSGVSHREMILYKGGDFELLLTVPEEKYGDLEEGINKIGSKISIIGQITDKDNFIVDKNGRKLKMENRGWEAFKRNTF
jgi:thiamine-monophosphate kinase